MTIYAAARRLRLRQRLRERLRPTLRLRLTLLNGVVLVSAGVVLIVLAWLLVGDALHPADQLRAGATVTLADGSTLDARDWQSQVLDATSNQLLLTGLLALLVTSVVGIAAAYVVAGRALRPLHRVTATARRLGEQTLDQRIRYSGADDEVAELARTFDAMLDRLGSAFESQKRFVANASHELRTPLAVMRTEIDVTMADSEADVAEYRRMATVVRDASARANGLVDALLILARSEAQSGRRLGRKVDADLADGMRSALSAIRREADRLKLDVSTDLAPAPVVGDPGLLERLAGNLVENAVRYNHLHGRIWARTGTDIDQAFLVVGNTGFEVDPADVPGLFEPFRRGGRERTGARGSGLGLSIVRAVCDAHGGSVTAVAQEGGGLEVRVTLPAASITPIAAGTAAVARAQAPVVARPPAPDGYVASDGSAKSDGSAAPDQSAADESVAGQSGGPSRPAAPSEKPR